MTIATVAPPDLETLADLLHQLGDIPPQRVRLRPPPGTATEQDVIDIEQRENRLFELVDGVLVEKGMGYRESLLACAIIEALRAFVRPRNLGIVTGEAGMMRLFPGLVRIPDVAFASWQRLPDGRVPVEPIPSVVPDIAVEVLSQSNTPAEMARKRREYFQAGVRLVWLVDLDARTVTVFTGLDTSSVLHENHILNADPVLPGFSLSLTDLFAELSS